MATPRRPGRAPVIPSNSIVSSAVRFPKNSARIYHNNGKNWQSECYRHYSICGEARYAARFFGHAMSRARIGILDDAAAKTNAFKDSGEAAGLLDALFNGKDGQAQMLESIGVHLTIAGECFLIGRNAKDPITNKDSGEIWEIVSPLEVQVNGATWLIDYGSGTQQIELTDDDVVIRIWSPRPGARMEADSPFRALLPILSEIEWLTRHVFAQVSSRLAGAGVLFMPDGMTFPAPPEGEESAETADATDAFMLTLADAMMTPIEHPESPSALVPVMVTGPADAIDKVKLLKFWSELDANAIQLRGEAIHRFAQGMDLPVEEILGMSSNHGSGGGKSNGVSHWGAWQIEESTIKMHVEPMLELVTNALTVSYIRPSLETATPEVVGYETSALRLRPDRSKEALELNALGLVKDDVVIRENGFDPILDKMSDDDRKIWLLRKVASGSATPEQVNAALKELGVDLGPLENPDALPRETRPDPSITDHPERPRTPEQAALIAACDGLVWRALEKAGNRHLNAGTRGKDRDKTVDPTEFHVKESINGEGPALLNDAFAYAPRVLAGHPHPEAVIEVLRQYCLTLFADQSAHSRDRLAAYMERAA